MRVLITGSNGFIGSYLAEACLAEGWDVTCLVRKTSDLAWIENLDARLSYGDLSDPASLEDALTGQDLVMHLAGRTKAPDQVAYMAANAAGTRNLFEAVLRFAPGVQHVVHTSSQAAAGPSPFAKPVSEDAPPRPLTWYGMSKLESERICKEFAGRLPITVIRPPTVYGPRDRDVLTVFKLASFGIAPYIGDREKYVSIVHVADLARAYILAVKTRTSVGRTYFVANAAPYPFSTIMRIITEAVGKPVLKVRVPHDLVHAAAFVSEMYGRLSGKILPFNRQKAKELCARYWTCDTSKAQKELGFESRIVLEDGMRETAEWYRRRGWI